MTISLRLNCYERRTYAHFDRDLLYGTVTRTDYCDLTISYENEIRLLHTSITVCLNRRTSLSFNAPKQGSCFKKVRQGEFQNHIF